PRQRASGAEYVSGLQSHRLSQGSEMNTQNTIDNPTTRRAFLGGATALAAWALTPRGVRGADAGRPNSVFNGVRIGCITYSYRGEVDSAEEILKALIQDGLSEVEMMGAPIQAYAGMGGGGRRGAGQQKAAAPARPTDAQREAQLAKCAEL